MMVMLFAYITYLFNAAQFIVKGIRSGRERRALAATDLPVVGAQQ
jgi:3-vinyl bacteriochlorophyllide hydratase